MLHFSLMSELLYVNVLWHILRLFLIKEKYANGKLRNFIK